MCPDAQILSAYFDGEVPEPWKSRMEEHVSSCPACKERLAGFASQRAALSSDSGGAAAETGCLRAWNRIEADIAKRKAQKGPSLFWDRSVHVPLPLAAAALLALSIVPAVTVASLDRRRGPALAANAPSPTSSGIAQASLAVANGSDFANPVEGNFKDIESLIRFLDAQNLPVTINVELPADRNYGYSGPPEIIKVSDAELKKGGK
jgi:anti-sigma factor RsiW